jgi:predicted RNase H-like nuclease (RuvC/YqgF family)
LQSDEATRQQKIVAMVFHSTALPASLPRDVLGANKATEIQGEEAMSVFHEITNCQNTIKEQQAEIERLRRELAAATELIDQLKRDAPTELERLARHNY